MNSPQNEAQLHRLPPDVFSEVAVFTQAAEQSSYRLTSVT